MPTSRAAGGVRTGDGISGQELARAMDRDELSMCYQPQFDLETGRLVGFEALLRWTSPLRGAVPPDLFVPVAEREGLINRIGDWVLRQALGEAAGWPSDLSVAVNLSPAQLNDPALARRVTMLLAAFGLAPSRLEIEITESAGDLASPLARRTLAALRAAGVRIAMDDFGAGSSSLERLASLPFDRIKLDRALVSGMAPGNRRDVIVQAVAALGRSLGVPVTAEGVETGEQLDRVRQAGCQTVQGFLFGRPLPAAAMAIPRASRSVPRRVRGGAVVAAIRNDRR
ncbi:EAL domain-containing protein [Rhizosaccharibacter radicis]|uniref:EAL domain-containing protein n=1 Tax=Rhizosaccharibacter radicis TaxID=2782605 RepID=A0ABT1VT88_9PROT|nr:EAL domain-containing protein [Acetobacteraceae bacterium KSS12]